MNPALLILSAAVVFIVATSWIDSGKADRKLKERIRQSWGKPPEQEYKQEDLDSIASCFLNHRRREGAGFAIDDTTCRDLEMHGLFARLNGTETTAGEETLYRLLREPCFDPEVLAARADLIRFFQKNRAERESIQFALAKLGKRRAVNPTDYFFRPAPASTWRRRMYQALSLAALASPLLLFFSQGLGALAIVLAFATNMFVYYSRRSEIRADLAALGYIVQLVQSIGRMLDGQLASPGLRDFRLALRHRYESVRAIGRRRVFLFFIGSGAIADLLFEYVRILLLRELIDYENLRSEIYLRRDALWDAYTSLGFLDGAISIASFRESVPFYCEPDLLPGDSGRGRRLEFVDLYHPLIRDPVANSLSTDRPILVTGSNASGKSTFLKTVAVNAILAQSFYTCLARRYTTSLFTVFTSMALRDNLRDGESYFVAEIKSIKRILDSGDGDGPCLCLIDEVLRGTNTVERIAASSQVLLELGRQNRLCLAATHDVELTFILENDYRNVHFQERITDDGVEFDYTLRDGRAAGRNAIRLLRLMGYGASIVEDAERRADGFLRHGRWLP